MPLYYCSSKFIQISIYFRQVTHFLFILKMEKFFLAFFQITFRNVSNIEVELEDLSCKADMTFYNSSVAYLANTVSQLAMKDSSALDIWAKGEVTQAKFENSSIESLKMEGKNIRMSNCIVQHIHTLKVSEVNIIENTHIHEIHSNSLVIGKGSSLSLANVEIDIIHESAVRVMGFIKLQNVTVHKISVSSVYLSSDSSMFMKNARVWLPARVFGEDKSPSSRISFEMKEFIIGGSYTGNSDFMSEKYKTIILKAGIFQSSNEWKISSFVLAICILACTAIMILTKLKGSSFCSEGVQG